MSMEKHSEILRLSLAQILDGLLSGIFLIDIIWNPLADKRPNVYIPLKTWMNLYVLVRWYSSIYHTEQEEIINFLIQEPYKYEVKIQFSLTVNTVDSMLWLIPKTQISASSVERVIFSCNNILKEFSVCLYLAPFDCKVQKIPEQTACTSGIAENTSHSHHTSTCVYTAGAPSSQSRSGKQHSLCYSPLEGLLHFQRVRPFPTNFGLCFVLLERDCWREWNYYLQTWKVA